MEGLAPQVKPTTLNEAQELLSMIYSVTRKNPGEAQLHEECKTFHQIINNFMVTQETEINTLREMVKVKEEEIEALKTVPVQVDEK